ncbi:EpsG family protein [Shewanella cyperi]|uniref:EpsG family protein n=1 Tax=Shewanella cyperi TaxID=2814292 RepID=A0A974XI98_9GAMM|nr:EpsG family protein [Shewanella cyperi]QSX28912.1 EpsG family protein [Shewanella cyperi]
MFFGVFYTLFSITVLLSVYSPYISLLLCFPLLLLLNLGPSQTKLLKFIVLVILVFFLSYLASSRGIFETAKDDLADYYKNFLAFSRGNYYAFFEFGGGIEVGFSFVSFLISLLFPFCSPRLFLFIHLLVINSFYFIFLHQLAKRYDIKYDSLLVLVACLFLGYTGESNLLRQSYSSVLILLALLNVTRLKYFLIILASLFHLSAIPVYIFFNYFKSINLKKLFLVLFGSFTLLLSFSIFLGPFLEQYRFLKIDAYLNGEGVDSTIIINAYKEFFIILALSFFFWLTGRCVKEYWLALLSWLLVTATFEVVMSGISLRINHMMIIFLVGPLFYFFFAKDKILQSFFALIFVPILLFGKVYSFSTNDKEMALFSDGVIFHSTPFGYLDFVSEDIPNDKREWKRLKYN